MERRRYLAGAGATLGTVLAGCSGSSDAEGGSDPVESGEVSRGSDDYYVEVESGDTIRVEITNEDAGRSSVVDIVDPDNNQVIREEDIEDERTITHEAEFAGDWRVIIFTAGTASYEIYVE